LHVLFRGIGNLWVRFQRDEKITVTDNAKLANFEIAYITPLQANIVFLVSLSIRGNVSARNIFAYHSNTSSTHN